MTIYKVLNNMMLTEDYVREVLQEASDILDNALPADMYKNCVHNINNIRLISGVSWWAQILKGAGRKRNDYDIKINYQLFEAVPEENQKKCLLTTLCHELIHTVDDCFNHREKFKHCAKLIREYTNDYVCVTRKKTLADWGGDVEDVESFKYIVICKKCGAKWGYVSKPRSYGNERYFECRECGGDIIVKKKVK